MPFIGNIGPGELILLLIIILVIFGPGRLPEIGNAVGKGIREFRKAATDVTDATRIDPAAAPTAAAAPPVEPAASTAVSAPSGNVDEDRRRYEELKARFEPGTANESHDDAAQPSA